MSVYFYLQPIVNYLEKNWLWCLIATVLPVILPWVCYRVMCYFRESDPKPAKEMFSDGQLTLVAVCISLAALHEIVSSLADETIKFSAAGVVLGGNSLLIVFGMLCFSMMSFQHEISNNGKERRAKASGWFCLLAIILANSAHSTVEAAKEKQSSCHSCEKSKSNE